MVVVYNNRTHPMLERVAVKVMMTMLRLMAVAWRGDGDAAIVGGGVDMEMKVVVVWGVRPWSRCRDRDEGGGGVGCATVVAMVVISVVSDRGDDDDAMVVVVHGVGVVTWWWCRSGRSDDGDDVWLRCQDKYVTKILKKFGFTDVKTASTPMETHKPLLKDVDGEDVDEHLYRSMIGSLMYLTSSRPDIMFEVCACARYQVNPEVSHLHAVKRIFRYLKGQPKLGLWYPKKSPFDLVAYTDSDYAGASLDRKSIIGGCPRVHIDLMEMQEADCGC
ncbi:hypothetical protein Tco_1410956 [Tanacetum coccineum]